MNHSDDYLAKCSTCTRTTSKFFARAHGGRCKRCATALVVTETTDSAVIPDSHKEGRYDIQDYEA